MICRRGQWTALLGFLFLFSGCIPLDQADRHTAPSLDFSECPELFPTGPWESVYQIEAIISGKVFSSLFGVTKGDPAQGRLHSLLLTPEGFILFEGELGGNGIVVHKSVPPFDSSTFAGGLMEDVKTLFLSPAGRPKIGREAMDGARFCFWEGPDGFRTEIRGSADQGWQILRRDAQGETIKEVSLNGPYIQGLATHLKLRSMKPASYRLKMTLIQVGP